MALNSPDPRVPPPAPVRRGGPRVGRALALLVLIGIAGVAAWAWITLHYAYSEGERAGVLQKFSRKGWICKTYEGELALYVVGGVSPQIWYFSLRDPALVDALSKAVGERVQLHYSEHRGIPTSCFGETSYFVESFRFVRASPPSAQ